MRVACIFFLPLVVSMPLHVFAGRLDIAFVQFSTAKSADELQAALAGESLSKITNADRVRARDNYLNNGFVVFAQSLGCSPGQPFSIATRMRGTRIDTSGVLNGRDLTLDMTFFEESAFGLLRKSKGSYSGSVQLAGSNPTILSLRVSKVKERLVIKNDVKPPTGSEAASAVLAQFTP